MDQFYSGGIVFGYSQRPYSVNKLGQDGIVLNIEKSLAADRIVLGNPEIQLIMRNCVAEWKFEKMVG